MKITQEQIVNEAGPEIFSRGKKYYQQNRVTLAELELDRFDAQVQGAVMYHVQVQKIGENFYSSCTCPYWTTCKHVVAAMLQAKDYYDQHEYELLHEKTHPSWKKFFNPLVQPQQDFYTRKKRQQWRVVYLMDFNVESWSITPQKAYLKRNNYFGRFTNIGEFDPENKDLLYAENDPIILSHIQRNEVKKNSIYDHRYFSSMNGDSPQVFHYKYGSHLGPLFDLMRQSVIFKKPYEDQLGPIQFAKETCRIEFIFQHDQEHYRLVPYFHFQNKKIQVSPEFKVLTDKPVWIFYQNEFIKVENKINIDLLLPFTKDNLILDISREEFPSFLQEAYGQISKSMVLPLPDDISVKNASTLRKTVLDMEESEKHLELFVKYDYEGHLVDALNPEQVLFVQNGEDALFRIHRDIKAEEEARQRLLDSGLKEGPRGSLRIVDSRALKWLFVNMPTLHRDGFEFIGRENLTRYKVRTGQPNVRVAVTTKIDWFDLNLEIDIEGVALTIKELRKAIRKNVRYVQLVDKSIAQLSEEWFQKFRHLFNFSTLEEGAVKVANYHVTLIDLLFEKAEIEQADDMYFNKLEQLTTFSGIQQHTLPKSMHSVLRTYQKAGYDWLYFLKNYRFGGCLADDMGLGKTLQTLALLLNEKHQGNKTPSLIVCPTSVVFNWEKEVQKFTPQLNVLIHTGLQRQRSTENFQDYDIILTSYGLLRRDIAFLKDYQFHYAILDESQKIKNPASQTAKAARLVNADHRLVLTGTPVENNTVELWSQFSFLNPGLLGSLNYFRQNFTLPIEKKNEIETAKMLQQIIYPFILRRTKEGVAQELPPKHEQVFYCTMNAEQERLYTKWKNFYRAVILEKIDTSGLEKAKINVLEGLVKLRQIACHSYLVDQTINEDSGKFESLKELIDEILSENHKVLVFSQFVRMLTLVRNYLDEHQIPYAYLDGHTRDRQQVVDRFQNDKEVKIFLISLKAGGVGLNLTAADYVIHYDPWWNPAVEVQATDRAHRIGQTKKVFVYRMITKNSVEEKMLELQDRKRKLVDDLISTDSNFFKNLTRQDIEVLFT